MDPPEKDEAPAQSARTHSGRPTATFLPIDMFAVCCDTKRYVFLFLRIPSTVSQYLYNSRKKRHSITVSTWRQKKCPALFWIMDFHNAKEKCILFNPQVYMNHLQRQLSAILLGIRQKKSHAPTNPFCQIDTCGAILSKDFSLWRVLCRSLRPRMANGNGKRQAANAKNWAKHWCPTWLQSSGDRKKICRSKIKSNSKKEDTYVVSLLYIVYIYIWLYEICTQ